MRTFLSATSEVLPVPRSKEEARRLYDRISGVYDLLAGPFERKTAHMGLERLSPEAGEQVLEIGFGSGLCLNQIAMSVGPTGTVCGIDLSTGMIRVARRRLRRTSMIGRTELCCGDGQVLPFRPAVFDAVFMSFALELFDTPDIPKVLAEARRVLTRGGRLGAVSMSREGERGAPLRLYEWAHTKWPASLDCRPIYLEQSLEDAGFEIRSKERVSMLGLPGEVIVASSESSSA